MINDAWEDCVPSCVPTFMPIFIVLVFIYLLSNILHTKLCRAARTQTATPSQPLAETGACPSSQKAFPWLSCKQLLQPAGMATQRT